MKSKEIYFIIIFVFFSILVSKSQTIFFEDFEGVTHPNLPVLWSTTTLGSDSGFYTGNSDSAMTGNFWLVKDHSTFAMTNDDVCNCDKSDDYLIMPTIDLSGYIDSTIFLQFDAWMENFWGGIGMIKIDTGSGWIDLYTIEPFPDWQTRLISLSQFAGCSNVSLAFHYNDEGQAGLGLAIDNISVYIPAFQYDAAIYSNTNTYSDYLQIPFSQLSPINLSSTVYNAGKDTLVDVKLVAYTTPGGFVDTVLVGNLSPAEYSSFSFTNDLIISNQGTISINYSIIHSKTDDNIANNTESILLHISDSVLTKESGTIDDAQFLMDGESIAQVFRVFNTDTLSSVTVNLIMATYTDSIKFYIYEMSGGFPDNILDSSETFTFLSTGWSTFYFSGGIKLLQGEYAIGMKKMGGGVTGLSATTNEYIPNTTFTSHFFMVDYFWYWDEQSYLGSKADHHTYILRLNFNNDINTKINDYATVNNNVLIYPNPSKGKINIIADNIIQIKIFDYNGKIVFNSIDINESQTLSNVWTKEQYNIDLSNISEGVYFIKIITENAITTKPIIIYK